MSAFRRTATYPARRRWPSKGRRAICPMVSRRRAVACREWRKSSAASPPRSDLSALGRARLDAAGQARIGSIAAGLSRFFGIGCFFPTLPTTNFPRTGLRHRGFARHYPCKFGQFFVPVFSADLHPLPRRPSPACGSRCKTSAIRPRGATATKFWNILGWSTKTPRRAVRTIQDAGQRMGC
jgi:hypothetical protein